MAAPGNRVARGASWIWNNVVRPTATAAGNSISSAHETLTKKIWYRPTAQLKNATTALSQLRPILDRFIDSLQRLAKARSGGAQPAAALTQEVQTNLTALQLACGNTHRVLDALIQNIDWTPGNYGFSVEEYQSLTACLNSLTPDQLAALWPNMSPDALGAFDRTFVTALEIVQSWSEERGEWLLRKASNIKHKFNYREEHRVPLQKCRRFVKGIINNISAHGIRSEATHCLIKETVTAINELLDACAPGHRNPGFDAAQLRPILQLRAALNALLLHEPDAIGPAIHQAGLRPRLDEAHGFLANWARGGLVQRTITTPLRQQEDPELQAALRHIAELQRGAPDALAAIRNLSADLTKILLLNEADPQWITLNRNSERRMEKTRDLLTTLGAQPVISPADLLRAKDYALVVQEPLLEAANRQTGYIKQAHEAPGIAQRAAETWRSISYTSVPQIMELAQAIENLNRVRTNRDASNEDVRRMTETAIAAITQCVQWSRETGRALTPSERYDLDDLRDELDRCLLNNSLHEIRDTALLPGNVDFMLDQAQRVLDRWKKSTVRRNQAALPARSNPLQPVTHALTTTQALVASTRRGNASQIEIDAVAARNALDILHRDISLGLIGGTEEERRRLLLQIEHAQEKAYAPDLRTSLLQRAELHDALLPLSRSLPTLVAQQPSEITVRLPFMNIPPEFRQLSQQLAIMEQAVQSGDEDQILHMARLNLSLLTAILQLAGGRDRNAVAKKYQFRGEASLEQLYLLQTHLLNALRDQELGSCDPENPQFHFFETGVPFQGTPASATSFALTTIKQSREYLERWTRKSDQDPHGGLRFLEQSLVGTRRTVPQLPENLLQEMWRLFLQLNTEHEQAAVYQRFATDTQRAIAAPGMFVDSQLTKARSDALAVLTRSTLPTPQEAARVIGTLQFFAQQDVQSRADNTLPYEGLAGSLIKWGFGKAGASDTELAHKAHSLVQQTVHGYLVGETPSPLALPVPTREPDTTGALVSVLPSALIPLRPIAATQALLAPQTPPFSPEIRALNEELQKLENIVQRADATPQQILEATRRSLAFLTAILEIGGADRDQRAATYRISTAVVDHIFDLQASLAQIVINSPQGSCNPQDAVNFGYLKTDRETRPARQRLENGRAVLSAAAAADTSQGLLPSLAQSALGRRSTRLPESLLQARMRYYLLTLGPDERAFYDAKITQVRTLLGAESPIVASAHPQIHAALTAADQALATLPPAGTEIGADIRQNVANALGTLEFHLPQDGPSSTPGAVGNFINWGANYVIAYLGLQGAAAQFVQNQGHSLTTAIQNAGLGLLEAPTRPTQEATLPFGVTAALRNAATIPAVSPSVATPGSTGTIGNAINTAFNLFGTDTAAPTTGGAMDTIKWILGKGHEFFTYVKGKYDAEGLGAVPKLVIQSTSKFLGEKLVEYLNKLDREEDPETYDMLEKVLDTLAIAADEGTIDKASDAIGKALEYLGVLPSGEPSLTSDPFFTDLQDSIDKVRNFNVRKDDQRPVKEMIDQEKANFIKNTANFGPLKFIYEKFCGLKTPELSFYVDIMSAASAAGRGATEQAELKRLFLAKLEERGVSGFTLFIVNRILYPLSMWLSHRLLPRAFEGSLDWAENFIENNNKDTKARYDSRITKRTSGYLAILQSGFGRVANKTTITGTLEDELLAELDLPEVNGGYTHEAFYNAVSTKLIEEYILPAPNDFGRKTKAKSPLCWDMMFHRYMTQKWDKEQEKYLDESRWGNSVGQFFAHVLSWVLYPFLWVMQNITYAITSRLVKHYFPGEMIDSLVGQTLNSLQVNGYTHALNCVIYDQLKDVLILLKKHYGEIVDDDNGEGGNEKLDLKNMSSVDRENLRTLVKELFSVLPKSECGSPTELRKLLNEKSMLQKAQDGIDENYIYSQVTESALELIGLAFHTLLQKGQMQRLFYKFMSMANSIYTQGAPVDPAKFREKEEGVTRLLDNILQLTIDNSVDESFDYDRSKESRIAEEYTKEIEQISLNLLEKLKEQIDDLDYIRAQKDDDDPEVTDQLKGILDVQDEALQKLADVRSRVEASKELPHCQETILKLCKELNNKLAEVVEPVVDLYQPRSHYAFGRDIAPSLDKLHNGLSGLEDIFKRSTIRAADYQKALEQTHSLSQLVTALKSPAITKPCSEIERALASTTRDATSAQEKTEGLKLLREHLKDQNGSSTFSTWYQGLGAPMSKAELSAHGAAYKKLQEHIKQLPCEKDEHDKLLKHLKTLAGANEQTRHEKLVAWRKDLRVIEEGLLENIDVSQKAVQKVLAASKKALEKMDEFTVNRTPHATFDDIQRGAEKFRKWIEDDDGIQPPKLSPSKWPGQALVSRHLKSYVKGRIKRKVDGLVSFIRKPYNWRYGLFHHNFFLPFLDAPVADVQEDPLKVKEKSTQASTPVSPR